MSESITVDLGAVTAYADAVEQGYTGTREEFGELLANFAKRADEVKQDKEEVKQAKEEVFSKADSFDKHVEEEKNRVTEEFNSNAEQVLQTNKQEIGSAKSEALEEIANLKEDAVTQVDKTKTDGVQEITTLTNEKKALLENTVTNQKNLIESEGTKQIQAVENKGTATLATIPEDYTALNTSVNDLKDLMHMKAPAIVEEATSGTEITVNDSADGMRLQGLNVYGKSWQVSTTGKNLLNADEYYSEFKQSDGTYKGNVVNINNVRISLSEFVGKKVTLSVKVKVATTTSSVYIAAYIGSEQKKINGSMITSGLTGKSILTVKPALNTDYFIISYGSGNDDVTFSELQLELGSVSTSYEPYTGGKPSPSPDYPKEIESVGRVLSKGKNLFNFSKLNADYGLNTNDKTIVIPAKTNNVGYYNSFKELCPDIKVGDTYVLSAKTSNPEALRTVHLLNTNVDFNFGKAFILTEEQINDKITFYNNTYTEKENVISEIQLEEGSEVTSYEPYTGGVPALYQKNIEVGVTGKNLVNLDAVKGISWANKVSVPESMTKLSNDVYTISMKIDLVNKTDDFSKTDTAGFGMFDASGKTLMYETVRWNDDKTLVLHIDIQNTFDWSKIASILLYGCGNDSIGITGYANFYDFQIEKGTKATSYEPYKQQSFPITTPTGLHAIPVPSSTSGITYTDADGQAWIADEIDFERGKYIQRVWQTEFDGSEDEVWARYSAKTGWVNNNGLPQIMKARTGFCNEKKVGVLDNDEIQLGSKLKDDNKMFYPNSKYYDTSLSDYGLSNWKAHLAEQPLKVMTYLDNPIETDLSEEQIQAYKVVHTNKPTTIISNDADAWMDASYAADTKLYIDNKVQEIASAVIASASEAE